MTPRNEPIQRAAGDSGGPRGNSVDITSPSDIRRLL
jgi:hypothetical protein